MPQEQNRQLSVSEERDSKPITGELAMASAEQWSAWLAEQQQIALEVYSIKPAQLVADQRREQGISRDYKGREILELLQNAADAAKKAGVRGRIHVELRQESLIVANTGCGFSTGGVSSLQTADLSPKRGKNSQLIGSKGLGFRSVLNWSRHPIVLSGALQLAFSSRYAHGLVGQLAQKYDVVRVELDKQQTKKNSPVPLLPFPVDLNLSANQCFVEDEKLYERCLDLRAEGFDTVIGMPFDMAHGYDNAFDQLQLLRPEFLLFSDSIESLLVRSTESQKHKGSEKQWSSLYVEDDVVELKETDDLTGISNRERWKLYNQTGEIPAEYLRDVDDPDNYHIVVALCHGELADSDNLYSFFPTSIPLPVHALCHASLELEQNRKHLQECDANKFVLERLAMFLADIFEGQIAIAGDPYRALDLLDAGAFVKDFQSDIKPLQLALKDVIKERDILPVLSGESLSAGDAKSPPAGVTDISWMPAEIFPSVIKARNFQDKQLFDYLGVQQLSSEDFVAQVQGAEHVSLSQRAAMILGIIEQRLGDGFLYKGLLLDSVGDELSDEDRVFQPSASLGSGLVFPDWANIKILNTDLWQLLRIKKLRASVQMLSGFDVREYSLSNIVNAVIASANRAIDECQESDVRESLLEVLYQLYGLFESKEQRPLISKSNVFVLNRIGEWVSANELYFGVGYCREGNIVENLYASLPEKFLAPKSSYKALNVADKDWVSFFEWLGLERWPRSISQKKVESDFVYFAKSRMEYPAIFNGGEHIFYTSDELPSGSQFESVNSLDEIDTILGGDSDAVLAWLGSDARAVDWLRNSSDHGSLVFWPYKAQYARQYQGELPSYIHWKIKHVRWLTGESGETYAPVDCMVNDAAVSGLFPRPVLPTKYRMGELGLNANLLKHAWLIAGVKEGIDDLDSEEVYALLLDLPVRDPSGALAKKMYNWLIKTVDFDLDVSGEQYSRFVEKGSIYGKQGDRCGYFPVTDAYHVDVEGFPQELLRSLPVASLLKKRGAEKVKRLFGVNVLDREAVNEKVTHYNAAACTESANQHFQKSKRYIEIYRHSHFSKAPGKAVFERLQLVVCNQVQSEITFNEDTISYQLPPWTYSIQGDQLYISCKSVSGDDPFHPLLSNTIGDAIASIFGLTDGDSFSKIYQCDEVSRAELLGRMLGDDLGDDLDAELQRLIDEAAGEAIQEPVIAMGPVPDATSEDPSPATATESKPAVSSPESGEQVPGSIWQVPDLISVELQEHTPTGPAVRVAKRVSTGSGAGGRGGGSAATKSDGTVGERLAMLFEEQDGRFPLYIGHITGYETIAADVLSFSSAEDRANFESAKDQSAALIARVIEAKEKLSGGSVKLTVNEVNTAAQWKNKYFIYRFTPIDGQASEYQLTVLNNPLSQLDAVVSSIEISLDAAPASKKFKVVGLSESDDG